MDFVQGWWAIGCEGGRLDSKVGPLGHGSGPGESADSRPTRAGWVAGQSRESPFVKGCYVPSFARHLGTRGIGSEVVALWRPCLSRVYARVGGRTPSLPRGELMKIRGVSSPIIAG